MQKQDNCMFSLLAESLIQLTEIRHITADS